MSDTLAENFQNILNAKIPEEFKVVKAKIEESRM